MVTEETYPMFSTFCSCETEVNFIKMSHRVLLPIEKFPSLVLPKNTKSTKTMRLIQNLLLLLRCICTCTIFRCRRELRGTEGCVCKYMMYSVCLVYVNYVCLLKNVCNFKSIKIHKIKKKRIQ